MVRTMASPRALPAAAAFAALVGAPALAAAHIALTNPAPRATASIKSRPCGEPNSVRGPVPPGNVLAPGATVEVRWTETIGHPGHYRISFDLDGQDFTIPLSYNDTTQNTNVLRDLIPSRATTGATYTQMITLPNQACENCTLQLIQMMTDKPPYTTDAASNDIYFECADIALHAPGGIDAGPDAATRPDAAEGPDGGNAATDLSGGCGCRTSQSQPAGIAVSVMLGALVTRRRRRD